MRGISHIALVTRDFARLRAFYTELLGAEPAYGGAADTARGGPGFLRLGALVLHVFERPGEAPGGVDDAAAATPFERGRVDHFAVEAATRTSSRPCASG